MSRHPMYVVSMTTTASITAQQRCASRTSFAGERRTDTGTADAYGGKRFPQSRQQSQAARYHVAALYVQSLINCQREAVATVQALIASNDESKA